MTDEGLAPKSNRRALFKQGLRLAGKGVVIGGVLLALHELQKGRTLPAGSRGRLGLLRPPGALAEQPFLSSCVRCTRCADACPAQCILFFGPEAGALHGTPYIMAADRACTLCLECGRACPSGALEELTDLKQVRMGVARVDERLCVSHNGTGVCGACHTICPVKNKAITQGARNAPKVHEDACLGCGLCEEACIVDDRRAIQVFTKRPFNL